jgi:four helix bundle protein
MTIKKFEDLKVWKHAFSLTQNVYELTQQNGFERDYALKDQIRRASISVMNNISEGIDRSGNKEFIQFLAIAKGSAAEIRSMLYIAESQGYISENQFLELKKHCIEISRMIGGLIKYLKNTSYKGTKFIVKEPRDNYDATLNSQPETPNPQLK